jgi:hypothetical protein
MRTTMNWTTKGVAALATGTTLFCGMGTVTAVALTSHRGTAPAATAAPAKTATPTPPAAPEAVVPRTTTPAPGPAKIVYVPVPASAPSSIVNAEAVVTQYYQDITDHNYSAAWALGGSNLSGSAGYSGWVAGYATTASISLGTFSYFGSDQVQVVITALQTDGSTNTYQGTYTVENGQITSANITQAGSGAPAAPAIPSGTYAGYLADIHAAGITAPDTWIVQTGETLASDWRNGQTTAQTDQILLAGGILPGHLAAFDSITQQDLGA